MTPHWTTVVGIIAGLIGLVITVLSRLEVNTAKRALTEATAERTAREVERQTERTSQESKQQRESGTELALSVERLIVKFDGMEKLLEERLGTMTSSMEGWIKELRERTHNHAGELNGLRQEVAVVKHRLDANEERTAKAITDGLHTIADAMKSLSGIATDIHELARKHHEADPAPAPRAPRR